MEYRFHEILQARTQMWVAFSFSRGSSYTRDQTQVSHIAGRFFTSFNVWETLQIEDVVLSSQGSWKSTTYMYENHIQH